MQEEYKGFYDETISIKSYYKDIKKINVLSGDEQIELAIKAQKGDKEAHDKLISTNLRFVVTIAKEYLYSGIPLNDLISEGNIGLMEAVNRFDPDKGFKFISYAVWWIRHSLMKAVHEQSKNIRLPVNRINSINKIVKAKEELFQKLGREPTDDEIYEYADDITMNDIKSFNINGNLETSLDEKVNDDSETEMKDFVMSNSFQEFEDQLNYNDLKKELGEVMSKLKERECIILNMTFGLNGEEPSTLAEIGERLNLTNERVRQIKEETFRRLRGFENSSKLKDFLNLRIGSGEQQV